MELSRFERIMTKCLSRTQRVSGKIATDLGRVKPFDMTIVPDREQLYNYMKLGESEKQFLRQNFPAGVYEQYEQKMQELGRKFNG